MVSFGMLRRVALVRTDVSEEPGTYFIRVTRIGEIQFLRSVRRLLVAACVVPSSPILVTLMKEAPGSSETSAQDTILQSVECLLLWNPFADPHYADQSVCVPPVVQYAHYRFIQRDRTLM
jgi:hypothetical protein